MIERSRKQTPRVKGRGYGAVGRVVASDTRGPRIESSHRQLLLNIYLLFNYLLFLFVEKTQNKEKEAGNGPFFIKTTEGESGHRRRLMS